MGSAKTCCCSGCRTRCTGCTGSLDRWLCMDFPRRTDYSKSYGGRDSRPKFPAEGELLAGQLAVLNLVSA